MQQRKSAEAWGIGEYLKPGPTGSAPPFFSSLHAALYVCVNLTLLHFYDPILGVPKKLQDDIQEQSLHKELKKKLFYPSHARAYVEMKIKY